MLQCGGFLTGAAIEKAFNDGKIYIYPFNKEQMNPNSYNLSLDNTLKVVSTVTTTTCDGENHQSRTFITKDSVAGYTSGTSYIDPKLQYVYTTIIIPEHGYLLEPGKVYLATTVETIGSNEYIPMITGRSSMGRLGINVHQEAGFGDIGYFGKWTMQISVIYPTMIYPNMKMAQMYFVTPEGTVDTLYHGKYQGVSNYPAESKSWVDFQ